MAHDLASEVSSARSDNRLATVSWTQLRSPTGAPIPPGDRPVLAVIAGFIRHINPLQYSRSFTKLFESPEHEGMADNVRLRINAAGDTVPSSTLIPLSNGLPVSYQQTIALAGDFYGDPDKPISDGDGPADQQQRFITAYGSLDGGSPTDITNILNVMQQQGTAVVNLAATLHGSDAYSQAFTKLNKDHYYDKLYNQASGGSGDWTWLFDKGSYLELAATNWDHFGYHAVTAYTAGHTVALQAAAAAGKAPADQQRGLLLSAYLMDAFASHFLADLFSAGHIRTPRKSLHHDIDPFPDLLSQMGHDEDSYNGLMATSVFGNAQNPPTKPWPAYGDKRMLDGVNETNLAFARNALQVSCDEVYAAFANPNASIDSANFHALDYIPTIASVAVRSNTQNWPPLFYRDDLDLNDPNNDPEDVDFRLPVTDLDSTSSMEFSTLGDLLWVLTLLFTDIPAWISALGADHLAYFTIWLATPAGGVHSIEGAPPGWLTQVSEFAHPFQWAASYPLTNQNRLPIAGVQAPSAAVSVTSLVDDGTPIDDATHANDVLHLFYKQDAATTNIMHLTTPMSVVSGQSTAGVWSPGCTVETLNFPINYEGEVAAVETAGMVTIVFPDASQTWQQAIITPQRGIDGPQPVFSPSLSGVMLGSAAPALTRVGSTLLFFFNPMKPGFLYYSIGTPPVTGTTPPFYVWTPPFVIRTGQQNVSANGDPSVIFVNDYVYVAVGGRGIGPYRILIYRCPFAALTSQSWELYLNGITDGRGNQILTQSFAQLFNYGDGYAVVGVDPNTHNLFTAVPLLTSAPKQGWSKQPVSVPNPQFAVPTLPALMQTTRTTPSAIFYGGNPYLFFADDTSTDLSMVTSKPPITLK